MRWTDQKDPLHPSGEISSGLGDKIYMYWDLGKKDEAFTYYSFDFLGLIKRNILLFILFLKVYNNRTW